MKRLFTFLGFLLFFSGVFAQVDSIPKLIISEWRGDTWNSSYIELTNVGDTALDLSNFMLFSARKKTPLFLNSHKSVLSHWGWIMFELSYN